MRRSDMEEIEYLLEEDPNEAAALCERIVEDMPDDADAWAWLSEAQLATGAYEDALKSLGECALRDPDWIEAYTRRAELMADLGRFDAAEVELEVARALDSEDPRLTWAQAIALELAGRFEKADELYGRAGEMDPTYMPPPRFDRTRAKQAINRVLKDAGKDGLKLNAQFEEIPNKGTAKKLLSRGLELRDSTTVIVYLRNLERQLDAEAELTDREGLFEERLAALVEAN